MPTLIVRFAVSAMGTILLALVVSTSTPRAASAEPPALRPLAFLVGEWAASGSGQPGAGAGTATFAWSLQGQVILRTSYAEYPAADGKPATRHDDLIVIHVAPGGEVRADYYDNEGHVIHYTVRSPAAGQAVFLSDAVASEPRYRLTYRLEPGGVLAGRFEIAPPGTPDAFTSYLTWRSTKAAK